MAEHYDFEKWVTENWTRVERAIAATARQQGIRDDYADDFKSWATVRLIEHGYAILQKWREESSLFTFLAVVLQNLGREYRVMTWGRWRPSAAALRLGFAAVHLERLVYRDGRTLAEAAAGMRTAGVTQLSDRELGAILDQLPVRHRARVVDGSTVAADTVAAETSADDDMLAAETDADARDLLRALQLCLTGLASEERVVVRMHFQWGYTLAEVARAIETPQKPLYRIRDRALRQLASCLGSAGFERERVFGLLGGAILELPSLDGGSAENEESREIPRTRPSDKGHVPTRASDAPGFPNSARDARPNQ